MQTTSEAKETNPFNKLFLHNLFIWACLPMAHQRINLQKVLECVVPYYNSLEIIKRILGVAASGSSFISGGFDEGMVGRETWRQQHKVVNNSSLVHLFFEKHYKYKRLKKMKEVEGRGVQ